MSDYESYTTTLSLMQLPEPPSAIFCFNDRMAMDAYFALQKLGLSIPKDVAVIGFDNLELIATSLHPGLTTVALPHYEMGRWAVQYLFELIENPDKLFSSDPVQYKITCPVVERHSVNS